MMDNWFALISDPIPSEYWWQLIYTNGTLGGQFGGMPIWMSNDEETLLRHNRLVEWFKVLQEGRWLD